VETHSGRGHHLIQAARRPLPIGLLLLLACLAGAVAAQAAFSPATTISAAGQNASRPEVAVLPNGNAIFVWRRFDGTTGSCCTRIQARARSAAGVLSPIQTLSVGGQNADHPPQLGVDASGNAVFVWRRFTGASPDCCAIIQARARSAAGALGPVQNLSTPGQNSTAPQVAVAPNGNAIIVWSRVDGSGPGCCERIQFRTRSAAGTLGPIQTISSLQANQHSDDPEVAVDPSGNAVFVWERFVPTSPGCCKLIEGRSRSAGGTLSPVQALSTLSVNAGDVRVVVDASGNAVISWLRSDQTSQSCCVRAQTRARSAAGTLSPVQTLSNPGQDAADAELGVDASGNAVFVFTRRDGTSQTCCDRIQIRTRSAAGTLGPIQILSAAGQRAVAPRIGVDASGNAVIAWARSDGSVPGSCCTLIQARSRSAAGALSPTQTLSAPGQNASRPVVGVDPDGGGDPGVADAIVTWPRFDGARADCCDRIQFAAQIAP
jgi:hypothetical protein